MDQIQQLRDLVCNARYFCADFPPSREQRKSKCVNCGDFIVRVCVCGTADLPVMCKRCYDVLKFTFGVYKNNLRSDSENDDKQIISTPRNVMTPPISRSNSLGDLIMR